MNTPSFKIKGEEYKFTEVTIGMYKKLQILLLDTNKKTEYEIVSLITGCPVDQLMQLRYQDWILIWDETQIQMNAIATSSEMIHPTIVLNGVEYGLPAVDDITVGVFADLDIIAADGSLDNNLDKVAAILYRPVISKKGGVIEVEPYNIGGYKERMELFQDLPLSAIKSANSFFLRYADLSLKNTVESLMNLPEMKLLTKEDQEKINELLQQDLGGESSISYLEKTLLDLKKLPNFKSEPLSIGLRGKKLKPQKKKWSIKNLLKNIKDN
jgi:hypothetical protein